jgi:hypothetical protein
MPTLTIDQYIAEEDNASARHFAPGGLYHGALGAFRFARELGYGLADFPDDQIGNVVQGLYSLLVRHTFGTRAGVPVDAKPFFAEVRWAIEHARKPIEPLAEREARLAEAHAHRQELEAKYNERDTARTAPADESAESEANPEVLPPGLHLGGV